MNPEEQRSSSSGSVIYYPNAAKTYIYPPRQPTDSLRDASSSSSPHVRPSSSGTVIYYSDAPPTIIYPPPHHSRAAQSAHMSTSSDIGATSGESNKRKRGDSPPSKGQDSAPKTFGLV